MEIGYFLHQEVDKRAWDACLDSCPFALPYAYSWYLDVVSPGWEGVIGVDEQGEYAMVMPVPVLYRYGFRLVQMPFHTQQLGVFGRQPSVGEWRQMAALWHAHVGEVMSYHFHEGNQVPEGIFGQHYRRCNHLLDLSKSYDALLQGYNRDRRMNLKRAQRAEHFAVRTEDIGAFTEMFCRNIAPRLPQGYVHPHIMRMLERLYREGAARGVAQLHATQWEGRYESFALLLMGKGRIIYLLGCAEDDARRKNGRALLLDALFREHAGSGRVFDFESPDGEQTQALTYHYASYGCLEARYSCFRYNHLPRWMKGVMGLKRWVVDRLVALRVRLAG